MISVVIPAHDEEQHIGQAVAAILAAGHEFGEPIEVIVVDDDSHDATSSIAEAQGARIVHVAFRQIAATRNAGAREASGEILFFVDADTLANTAVIRAAIDALRNGAAGGGCFATFDGVLPLWAKVIYPLMVFLSRRLRLVGGCFLFCHRTTFDAVGGFCERYYAAEEVAFINAIKKIGPFVIPQQTVITSGRKLRAHSGWQMMGLACRWLFNGPKMFQKREGLEIWYGPRSSDSMHDA